MNGVRMVNIGIDVGKKAMQVCIKDGAGKIFDELSLSNDSSGAEEMINIVNGMPARAVIEATTG
ncbi:MAG: hypothetical protein ACUVTL_00750 [Thermoproteota archaeon]